MEFKQAETADSSLGDAQLKLDDCYKFKDGWHLQKGDIDTRKIMESTIRGQCDP